MASKGCAKVFFIVIIVLLAIGMVVPLLAGLVR